MLENCEIISSLLGMFIVGLSVFIASKLIKLFLNKIKKHKFAKLLKSDSKIEVVTCDRYGIPAIIKVNGKLKVL